MNAAIKITSEIEMKDIGDLLGSALEGGSAYWATIVAKQQPTDMKYHAFDEDAAKNETRARYLQEYPTNSGGSLTFKADGTPGRHVLDISAIERGCAIMAEKYPRHWADFRNETGDATTGDVFLQCCLFGELVYG